MIFNHSKNILVLIVFFLLSFSLVADTSVFVREYTYSASENDSRVSARKAALQQLQSLVIEEVGVQVQSSFSQQTTQERDDFNLQVQANIQSFAQALTRTRILEERWDGATFYIKAEIEVDPNDIQHQLNQIITTGSEPVTCKSLRKEVMQLVRMVDSSDRNTALVNFSMASPIDEICYNWQYTVLDALNYSDFDVPMDDYQVFLLEQLEKLPPQELQNFIPSMLLLTAETNFIDQKWNKIMAAIQRSHSQRMWATVQSLIAQTHVKETNQSLVSERLWLQLNQLKEVAINGNLGVPSLSNQDFSRLVYNMLNQSGNDLTYRWLAQEYKAFKLTKDLFDPIISKIVRNPENGLDQPSGKTFVLLIQQLDNYTDEQLIELDLFYSILGLIRNLEDKGLAGQQAINQLNNSVGENLARVLNLNKNLNSERDLFFVKYQLPNSKVCQPAECAKRLFSESKFEARLASELLLAYGESARAEEASIIRKLDRLLITSRGGDEAHTKNALIQLLQKFQTNNKLAIELIIRSLDDSDYQVPKNALTALINLYPISVPVIQEAWLNQKSPLVQQRLIESLGKMPKDKNIEVFLKGITPKEKDHELRFALEDALMAQKR